MSSYVKESERKHRYSSRACTYYIKRISEPMDQDFVEFTSIREIAERYQLSDYGIRQFAKSPVDSEYIKSRRTGVLYMLKKPTRDIVCSARCIDEVEDDAIAYQTFTSLYQLSKRFRISSRTVFQLKSETPIREETTKFVYDEFKRRFVLTFYK